MKLWGNRFKKEVAEEAFAFSASLPFDRRLWEYDLRGSIAHARMLAHCGIIPEAEAGKIIAGLEAVKADIQQALARNQDPFDSRSEDIHTEIERQLSAKIGELAGKLHTARSRNDQVALDLRLYLREACDEIGERLIALQKALISQAEKHLGVERSAFSVDPERSRRVQRPEKSSRSTHNAQRSTILPGHTHRQHAQPVLLSHHLLAYFWKFQRDRERFADCRRRMNISPLGAAAITGTSFPIDPEFVARELGFEGVFDNSMDAVSARDFAVEFLAAAALCMTHLSSLASELVLWSSPEFGFVTLDEAWCTGSSIMPQKRNPDIAEVVNAKAGRVFGHLAGLLSVLKGLPPTYNRDLQEDKEALFDSHDTLRDCLRVMAAMLESAAFQPQRMLEAVKRSPFLAATEVADYLARKGLPFRQAHAVVSQIVRHCEEQKKSFADLTAEERKGFSPLFEADVLELLQPEDIVAAKTSAGGSSPVRVKEALERAKRLCEAR